MSIGKINSNELNEDDNEPEEDSIYIYLKTKSENEEKSTRLYIIFVFLRIILTLLPQSGYIHPDEFIQSIEVVGGPILGVDVDLPWEFNRTNPIRSPTLSFFIHGIPLWFLKYINYAFMYLFDINIVSPYSILVFTRLVICIGSFLIDYSLYRICRIYSRPYHTKLTVLATSYVILVYGTRTFSNTIELILYSVFLWMISVCMYDHDLLVRFRKQFIKISDDLATPQSRVKHLKIIKLIEGHSLQHCFIISCLAVIGCYNRPTFVVFGAGPIFFWIHRGLSSEFVNVKDIHTRMFMFLISALPLILLFIFIDSFYFGYLTGAEILAFDLSLNNFIFAPWNFVLYNIDSNNLAEHGLHPKYTHLFVNLPLLFGPLAFIMFKGIYSAIFYFIKQPILKGYNRALYIDNLMRMAIFSPIILLSLIAHQEPRFVIPTILPIVFLYGDKIYDISVKNQLSTNKIFRLWMLFNLTMTFLYGFAHQGGVYQYATFMNKEISAQQSTNVTFHLITSHMYSFPRVLLNQPDSNIILKSSDGSYYQRKRRVYYYEQQSKSLNELLQQINNIYKYNNIRNETFKIYICVPSVLSNQFEIVAKKRLHNLIELKTSLFPHFSTEIISKPEIWDLNNYALHYKLLKIFSKLEKTFSLNVYCITNAAIVK